MTTYEEAGVDLAAAHRLVEALAPSVTSTWGPEVVGTFGGFAAGLRLPEGYRRPILMMTTDGVGTKAEVARQAGWYEGLGHDLVAMCVDDLAAMGATPLALVDYLAVGRLRPERDRRVVESVAAGCRLAGCALLGGETAEHPGVMATDQFDLAGAALGVVEDGSQVTGEAIRPGDRLVGVASPNLRCNGFSLVRTAILPSLRLDDRFPGSSRSVAEVLLEPSVIYAPAVLASLMAGEVHGLAHITGGGLPAKVARILPQGCRALVRRDSWEPPHVFGELAQIGNVEPEEMFRTFNMGVGFVAVVAPASHREVVEAFERFGHGSWEVGEVVEGSKGVELVG